LLFQEKRRRE